jgi:hypothetical protein
MLTDRLRCTFCDRHFQGLRGYVDEFSRRADGPGIFRCLWCGCLYVMTLKSATETTAHVTIEPASTIDDLRSIAPPEMLALVSRRGAFLFIGEQAGSLDPGDAGAGPN